MALPDKDLGAGRGVELMGYGIATNSSTELTLFLRMSKDARDPFVDVAGLIPQELRDQLPADTTIVVKWE